MYTENHNGRRQRRRIYWGIIFLLGAAALLLNGFGHLRIFHFWSVIFSIILLGLAVEGILKRSFGQILFSLAFLVILNDDLLHLKAITPWPVLGAALLGTIGLNYIFPKRWKETPPRPPHQPHPGGPQGAFYAGGKEEEFLSGEEIHYEVSFGYAVKYIVGRDISRVYLKSSFGNLEVYFNDASLKDNRADAFIECSFGNMELYVPAGWNVVIDTRHSFGSVEESGYGNPNSPTTLFLGGNVSFGHVEVHHI